MASRSLHISSSRHLLLFSSSLRSPPPPPPATRSISILVRRSFSDERAKAEVEIRRAPVSQLARHPFEIKTTEPRFWSSGIGACSGSFKRKAFDERISEICVFMRRRQTFRGTGAVYVYWENVCCWDWIYGLPPDSGLLDELALWYMELY